MTTSIDRQPGCVDMLELLPGAANHGKLDVRDMLWPLFGLFSVMIVSLAVFFSVWWPLIQKAEEKKRDQRYCRELRQMYDSTQAWKSEELTWTECQERGQRFLPRLNEMSSKLVRTANRSKPAQQCLLWLSRDRFPQWITMGPHQLPGLEAEMEDLLIQAEAQLDLR